MRNFVGNEKKVKLVESLARSKQAQGAYIFTGPDGVGKLELAEYFCHLLCGAETELNVYRIRPEIIETKKKRREGDIKVKEIRSAIDFMSMKSRGNAYKACLIEKAHKMTEGAQNALLKSLEEPKERSIFALVAESEQRLLPTIRSRSVILRLGLAHPGEILAALSKQGISEDVASKAVYYGWGKFTYSLKLAEQPALLQELQDISRRFKAYIDSPLYERMKVVEEEGDDHSVLSRRLDVWITFLTAGLESSFIAGLPVGNFSVESSAVSPRNIARILEELIALRRKMKSGGVAVRLALEAAVINF